MAEPERAFAEELIAARERRGLSQAAVARELKRRFGITIHQAAIARIERWANDRPNAQNVPLGLATVLAALLEISLDNLVSPDARLRAEETCVFCRIVAGTEPAEVVAEWDDAIAIVPLDPVTDGHTLVIPRVHVPHALADANVSADTMRRACQLAASMGLEQLNLITSVGEHATRTVEHLHIHLGPRRQGDGLPLLWTPQQDAIRQAAHIPDDAPLVVISYGRGHGLPPAADVTFDLRSRVRDPHVDPTLRELTGHDHAIQAKVRGAAGYQALVQAAAESALALAGAGTQRVKVALGCAGGRHRGVVAAEDVAALLRAWTDQPVHVWHRDIAEPVIQRPAAELAGHSRDLAGLPVEAHQGGEPR